MPLIGYARVSSRSQNLAIQKEKLKGAGCQETYWEQASGYDEHRGALKACLEALQPGDSLVVTQFDRLSRSYEHLQKLLAELEGKAVDLQLLDSQHQPQALGEMMSHMLAAFAAYDGAMRKARQTAGIHKAKQKGIKLGRKRKLTADKIRAIQSRRRVGASVRQLSQQYGLSQATIYRALSEARGAGGKQPGLMGVRGCHFWSNTVKKLSRVENFYTSKHIFKPEGRPNPKN